MRFDEHPFRVLDIGTRTKKAEILDRAQALLLTEDPERIQGSAAIVTHPAKRIDAEVSWFPGMPPAQMAQVLSSIERDEDLPRNLNRLFAGLDTLTCFNVIYFWIVRRAALDRDRWMLGLLSLAANSAKIEPAEVIELLNADRAAAGIPQIVDREQVAAALKRRSDE